MLLVGVLLVVGVLVGRLLVDKLLVVKRLVVKVLRDTEDVLRVGDGLVKVAAVGSEEVRTAGGTVDRFGGGGGGVVF